VTDVAGSNGVAGVTADIDLILAQVEALRQLASDRDKAQDKARVYDFSIRWGALLSGRLERLEIFYRRDELTPDEQARYAELKSQLREVLPLAEQLKIGHPTVPLDS
jgi:hypothetical protein